MPELPEVETIRRGLEHLCGKKPQKIFRSDKKLRTSSTLDLQGIVASQIKNIERRARYLIINFINNKSLIIHLGMSGKLVFGKNKPVKHDHLIIAFNNEEALIFNDPRRFGFVDLIETKNLKNHPSLSNLGPEPLSEDFNFAYLEEKLAKKKMNIKTSMMDNKIVVGVGNIYINESLFDSKISPLRDASSLTKNEIKKLVNSIKKILKNAIELGGSSINDYVNSTGDKGHFQNSFKIYGQAGGKCLICKDLIKKMVQNGRSSFYCQQCQE